VPTRIASYVTGFRAAYDDDPRNVLSLAFTTSPAEHEGHDIVLVTLDITASKVQLDEPPEVERVLAIVGDLEKRASDVFEKLITDHTRALFA
jgi:hypothetical protein